MFGKTKKRRSLLSPANGEILPLEETGDEVFAGRMVGDGAAVRPSDGGIASPCDGTVRNVSRTFHAYSIESDDGLDVLVHIGIDTVELGGEGFKPLVKSGDRVRAGQLICKADLDLIAGRGFSTITPVIISGGLPGLVLEFEKGKVKRGEEMLHYTA